jgi:hypothetical protein
LSSNYQRLCGCRPEVGDSQTLDFTGFRVFDKNGIEAKGPADDQGAIAAPRTSTPSVSDKLVVKRLTSASKRTLARRLALYHQFDRLCGSSTSASQKPRRQLTRLYP